jgi:hypothetical protein
MAVVADCCTVLLAQESIGKSVELRSFFVICLLSVDLTAIAFVHSDGTATGSAMGAAIGVGSHNLQYDH